MSCANVGTLSHATDFKRASIGARERYYPLGGARHTNITFPVHSGEHSSSPPSLRYHVGLGVFRQCFALFAPFSISRLSHLDGVFIN